MFTKQEVVTVFEVVVAALLTEQFENGSRYSTKQSIAATTTLVALVAKAYY